MFCRDLEVSLCKTVMVPVLICLLASGLLLDLRPRMTTRQQESIRAEIDGDQRCNCKRGAEWVAGETSVLRLSHAERQSRVDYFLRLSWKTNWSSSSSCLWRCPFTSTGGITAENYVTPIRDQRVAEVAGPLDSGRRSRISYTPYSGNAGCGFESLRTSTRVLQRAGSCGGGSMGLRPVY